MNNKEKNIYVNNYEDKFEMNKNKKSKVNKMWIIAVILFSLIIIFIGIYLWYTDGISFDKSKEDKYVILNIEENTNFDKLGDILKKNGLIKDKKAYKLFLKFNNNLKIKTGKYKIDKTIGLKSILEKIDRGEVLNEDVKITILEGSFLVDIINKFEEEGLTTKEEMEKVLKDKEYIKSLCKKYTFLDENIILNEDIRWPLEGYLFPDTYIFDVNNTNPQIIIETMLKQMEKVLKDLNINEKKGEYTVHEILTLASVVEKESPNKNENYKIAGLFLNRLKNNMSLGSDPTTHYEVQKPMNKELTAKDLQTRGKYNTRGPGMEGKLPIGPICSPSKSAIESVLNPENIDAIFFVSDKNKKIYYNKDFEGHQRTIKKLKDNNLWYNYD